MSAADVNTHLLIFGSFVFDRRFLRCCRHSRVRFLPISRGSDDGYLPSKAALRHASVTSDRIGLKKPEHTPQHHLRAEKGQICFI